MKLGPVLFWSTVALALLHAGSRPVTSNDLHIYLAMGRWMAQEGQLLEQEVFTWTAQGTPFLNGTWAFSVVAWKIHEALGPDALRLLNGLLVAICVGVLGLAARAAGADARAAAIGSLYAFALLLQNTVVRSQTWAFAIFGLLVYCVVVERKAWVAAGTGLVLGALWANLHGSFPAGLVFLGALCVGRAFDARDWRAASTPLWAGAGLLLGSCVGPYGPEIWAYVRSNSGLPVERGFVEWYAPSPTAFEGARFYGAIVLWIVLTWRERKRPPTADLLLLVGFGVLAATGTRFVAWFGLATTVPLAARLNRRMTPSEGIPRRVGLPMASVLAVLWVAMLARGLAPTDTPLHWDTPIPLVDALEQDCPPESSPPCRVLVAPEYGGYVAFRLWPGAEISGDIRTWVFSDEAWQIYLDLSAAGEDWEDTADTHGITHILTWKAFHGNALDPAARDSDRWELTAESEHGALFRRGVSP